MSNSGALVSAKAASPWAQVIRDIFADVKERDAPVVKAATKRLKQYVAFQTQELQNEHFTNFMHELNVHIRDLVRSAEPHDVQAGIAILGKLLSIEYEMSDGLFVDQWAGFIRKALHRTDRRDIVEAAAVCLGRYARIYGGTLTRQLVDFEVRRALENVLSSNQFQRQSALVVLAQLLQMVPTLNVEIFLDVMWGPLHDTQIAHRVDAVDVLRWSIIFVKERSENGSSYFSKIYTAAKSGIQGSKPPEVIHGSLLSLMELLANTSIWMSDKFEDVCVLLLKLRDHKSPLIRRTVLQCLPHLAAFDPSIFADKFLASAVETLLQASEKERDISYQALGELAVIVGDRMASVMRPIIISLTQLFRARAKGQKSSYFPEAYRCVAMLAKGRGAAIASDLKPLVVAIFAVSDFSRDLVECLVVIGTHVPPLRYPIQRRLLAIIARILRDDPVSTNFSTPSATADRPSSTVASPARSQAFASGPVIEVTNPRDRAVQLALYALSHFRFFDLAKVRPLLDSLVFHFLDHPVSAIRQEAAMACARQVVKEGEQPPTRGHSGAIVTRILERLLDVALTDVDDDVRLAVIRQLDQRFDVYLSQNGFLKLLFLFINDHSKQIQELSISLLGRLALSNPAYIYPAVRATMLDIMKILNYSEVARHKENAVRLFALIIRSLPALVKPYSHSIVQVLMARVKQPDIASGASSLASACIAALGDVAVVAGEDMRVYVDDLLPIVIANFQDQNNSYKKTVALRTLDRLFSRTGYVIDPLIKYPKLLDTILSKIKRATNPQLTVDLVKLLGTIGAIDPYRYKVLQLDQLEKDAREQKKLLGPSIDEETGEEKDVASDSYFKELLRGMSPQSPDYYHLVALELLMRFLKNPYGSLATLQMSVIQAVMTIFKSMGLGCVHYLKHFLPPLINVMEVCGTSTPGLRELLFQQLCIIVSILKHFTRDYLDQFIKLMEEYWHIESLVDQLIALLEEICFVLGDEFAGPLRRFIPRILAVLALKNAHSIRICRSFRIFGTNLDDHLHLIVPLVVALFDRPDEVDTDVVLEGLQTIGRMAYVHDISRYGVPIFHAIVNILQNVVDSHLKEAALNTACDLLVNLGSMAHVFLRTLVPVLATLDLDLKRFNDLHERILSDENERPEISNRVFLNVTRTFADKNEINVVPAQACKTNGIVLQSAWDTSHCFTNDDWAEWIRRISIVMLQESPSPSLRCLAGLAMSHNPVAIELFNSAFVSCWEQLHQDVKSQILQSMEHALSSTTIAADILHILLNLAEFMERSERPLPLNISNLGRLALKCFAYAKALHVKEQEFRANPEAVIGDLFSIYDHLGQHDASAGLLKLAQTKNFEIKLAWYEKLQKWIRTLGIYEDLQVERPHDMEVMFGRLRCLGQLGQWEELSRVAEEARELPEHKAHSRDLARFALEAALNLGRWEDFHEAVPLLEQRSLDGAFFRAIDSIHLGNYDEASRAIAEAREDAANDLNTLLSESYDRAYPVVVRIQQLSELEEIIAIKSNSADEDRKALIKKLWRRRLEGVEVRYAHHLCKLQDLIVQRNVDVWQSILAVRALVSPPASDPSMWIKFANLTRKNLRFRRSKHILQQLLHEAGIDGEDDDIPNSANPYVKYTYIKTLFGLSSTRTLAFTQLQKWVATFSSSNGGGYRSDGGATPQVPLQLQARAYHRLAQWQLRMIEGLDEKLVGTVIEYCKSALERDSEWHSAWHLWAIVNYRALTHYAKQSDTHPQISAHLLPAVTGFIRSIALAPSENLQDTLRLLTLWFTYGFKREIETAIKEGFDIINIDTWLAVIPQITARINIPLRNVRNAIIQLLSNLGKKHPQALVFPLTSQIRLRVVAAQQVISNMRQDSGKLIGEATLVSNELIRVAILWKERWYKGLEEASRLYYHEKKVDEMMAVLYPLHEMLVKGAYTQHEKAFAKAFGRDLEKAWECCQEYMKTRKESSMNLAWDLYAHVFRVIKKHLLTDFDKLHLSAISPDLLELHDLELAVPGTYLRTYKAGVAPVTIKSFAPVVKVIPSKQNPRKIVLRGSDGNEYPFLLKGHEDLRQDERVMQLFTLVNHILNSDDIASKNHLFIQRYSATPLSPWSGLIEWLPNSDTLHELLKFYRKTHNIALDAEHTFMQRFCTTSEYYKLPVKHKLEVFEYGLEQTPGDDLEKILWLNSSSSEQWLDKRTTYTKSHAVMCMVGYILGLGDRHPNNLMLNRNSGMIIHIDFGDCFEVAMTREKFAEQVPFRLTRMLVNAMEVAGIDGIFRSTCENVMRILRDNRESIMAVLEAFVYDPLINWRLGRPALTGTPIKGETDPVLGNSPPHDEGMFTPSTGASSYMKQNYMSEVQQSDTTEGDEMNQKALKILERVSNKLSGRDFASRGTLEVEAQIDLLVAQASSNEVLCQAYLGWCPYW